MSQSYNFTEPNNSKSSYTEGDVLDFIIQDTADKELVANSVVITADLLVEEPSGTRSLNKQVFFDSMSGAHAFIESVNVSSSLGQHEHLSSYSRMVAMFETVSKADNDTFNTSDALEMISTNQTQSTSYCEGNITEGAGSTTHIAKDCDFALKLRCCLNKMAPGSGLPFSKVGYVKVSVTLAQIIDALFSNEATPTMDYQLSNVQCRYKTQPTQNQQTVMRSVINVKTSINSSNANISAKVPGVANSVSMVFLKQADESNELTNGQRLDKIGIESVNFLLNDNLGRPLAFDVKDNGTILQNFIESVVDTKHNRIGPDYQKGSHGGAGVNWGTMIDLTNNKLNVELKTKDVSNSVPYLVDMFFHTILSI